MELTVVHLILVGILGFIAVVDGVGPKVTLLALPLVSSAAVGLIFGNLIIAVMTGATLQIMLIGAIPIGGASPPDGTSASIVGSALAAINYNPSMDLTWNYTNVVLPIVPFAIIVAVIGVQVDILARTANIVWVRRAERAIEKGNIGAIQTSHLLGFIPWGLSRAILCPLALVSGTAAVGLLTSIALSTTGVLSGLIVAGSVLPAAGLAIILSILPFRKMPWFFVMGFAVAAVMVLLTPDLGIIESALNPVLAATGLGFVVALAMVRRKYRREGVPEVRKSRGEKRVELKKLEQKDMSNVFRRYFLTFESSWNYERMQGLGYLFAMLPILKRVHKEKNELKEAMKMHMEFFNTNPFVASWIIGMNAEVEDKGAPPEAIRNLKVGYMGPLAGLGDSLIYFVIGGIAILLGSSISYLTGSIFGVIVLWAIFSPLAIIVRFWFFRLGLRRGVARAMEMSTSTGLKRVMELTGATGLATIGAFVPIAVQVGLPVLTFPVELQTVINTISLFVVPLALTLSSYVLARRGFSIIRIVLILFVVGFIAGFIGVLSRTIYWQLSLPT
jgi:PTS system mannose-specific IID component